MRIEAVIAFTLSAALHAGVVFLAPAARDTHGSAARVIMPPTVITAQLKNTLDTAKSANARSLQSAHAARSAGRRSVSNQAVQPVRVASTVRTGRRIDSHLQFYPPEAIAQGLEGEAIVMLRIGSNGDVLEAQIAKSSGHVILDEAALRAIRATPRFAPGPREILLPVTFALR